MENSNYYLKSKNSLDRLDWELLEALQNEARLSFSELGRRVNLSQPAVTERVKRLENAGIISGYHAHINFKRLGLPIFAIIHLTVTGSKEQFLAQLQEIPAVHECLTVTGQDCFVLRARLPSIESLDTLTKKLGRFGSTTTSIVLSAALERHTVTKD